MRRYILVDRSGKTIGTGFTRAVNFTFCLANRDGTKRMFTLWDLAKCLCPDVEDEDPTAVYWEAES
jgi:hypothetical protein